MRFLARTPHPEIAERIGALSAIVSGLSIAVGFLAPAFGAALAMEGAAIALTHVSSVLSVIPCKTLDAWLFVAVASASLLLGPGAYSVDARLFGRREIVIPSRTRPSAP